MTRTEEKLKLAEELGITGYITSQKEAMRLAHEKEEREAVIAELTSMKWKPLTEDSFKFFPKWKFVNRGWFSEPNFLFGSALSLIPIFLLIAFSNIVGDNWWIFSRIATLCVLSFSFIPELLTHIRLVKVASMPLSDWKDDLPYGALLAVKEAKECGVVGWKDNVAISWLGSDGKIYPYYSSTSPYAVTPASFELKDSGFKIYYPRLEARRVNADPIITGLYKGIEVEIFAWSDDKIRPEDY